MLHHPFYPAEIMEAIRDGRPTRGLPGHQSRAAQVAVGLWCALCASFVALALLVA